MKSKLKKILVMSMLFIMGSSIPVFAQPEKGDWKNKGPIFMGKVLEVEKNDKDSNIRIKVKGYVRGCEVYEEELIAIVNKDTEIVTDRCNGENKPAEKTTEQKNEKDNKIKSGLTDVNVEKGDTVFMRLNTAMTMSIPPQAVAQKIQITKIKK